MQAMIFAAGLGTRLRPLTNNMPKALVKINGKTLLERNFEKIKALGVNFVVVNVFYFGEQIVAFLKQHDGFGLDYAISYEQEEALETGGGLKKAFGLFDVGQKILTMNADILTTYDLNKLNFLHEEKKHFISLAVSDRQSSRELLFNKEMVLGGWRNVGTGDVRLIGGHEQAGLTGKAFSGISIFDYGIGECFLEEKNFL